MWLHEVVVHLAFAIFCWGIAVGMDDDEKAESGLLTED